MGSTTFSNTAIFSRTIVSCYRTVVYCLPIYACLPIYVCLAICTEHLLLFHPLIARLSTETAVFVSFLILCHQRVCSSVFVSGYIQTFTSASRGCHFHCCQPLCHRLAIQSFISPSCCRCRLHSRLVVRHRPLIRSLQLVVAIVSLPLDYFSFS